MNYYMNYGFHRVILVDQSLANQAGRQSEPQHEGRESPWKPSFGALGC